METDKALPIPSFRTVARPGRVIPWGVEKWDGTKWRPVIGAVYHYENGARQKAKEMQRRADEYAAKLRRRS